MKVFITHVTENYEEAAINLAISLKKYSKYPLIVYTINYEGSPELNSLATCTPIYLPLPELSENDMSFSPTGLNYVNRKTYRTYQVLGAKVECMLDITKLGATWVYLDSDCIANVNIDSIFDYESKITNYPISTLHPYECMMIPHPRLPHRGNPYWREDGSYDITATLEWPLMEFLGVKERKPYTGTGVMIGNKDCLAFIELWKNFKNLLPQLVDDLNWYAPFHEETIYNCLTWKQSTHNNLGRAHINIHGVEGVTHYLNHPFNGAEFLSGIHIDPQTGEKMEGFLSYPGTKEEVKVFHGEKRRTEAEKIFKILDPIKLDGQNFIDYDFIEIGTCDFRTYTHTCTHNHVGLAIEPLPHFINSLPFKANVTKIQAAISDVDGECEIYTIPPEVIDAKGLKQWLRGSNSMNEPHKFAIQELGEEYYNELVQKIKCPVLSVNTLFNQYKVGSVDTLKIDTEGHDHIILNQFLDLCEKFPYLYPNTIIFEYHSTVSDVNELNLIITKLNKLGYTISIDKETSDATATKSK